MKELWNQLVTWFATHWEAPARALGILVGSVIAAKIASSLATRWFGKRFDAQGKMLLRRGVYWPIALLGFTTALTHLGLDLSIFLGAAGIVTVAVGFASQTSASNLISGIFLVGERAFAVGDVIRVGTTSGEVLSIDLLSVKVRTFDNLFVRVPNEIMVKSEVTNLSRFPIRRIDLHVRVGYGANLDDVRTLLLGIAEHQSRILAEPEPLFFVDAFEPSGMLIQFSVWTRRENWGEARALLQRSIRAEMDDAGIPRPTLVVP